MRIIVNKKKKLVKPIQLGQAEPAKSSQVDVIRNYKASFDEIGSEDIDLAIGDYRNLNFIA